MSLSKVRLPYVSPDLSISSNVAIVGSSGNLTSSLYGELIDSYDEIVRFNRAPLEGYDKDVGYLTTLRVTNNHVFNNVDIRGRGYPEQPPNFIKDLQDMKILCIGAHAHDVAWVNRDKNIHESSSAYLFDHDRWHNLNDEYAIHSPQRFTVGTTFILLCIKAGIRPHLFGFDLEVKDRTHYWEARPSGAACHDRHSETSFIRRMCTAGKLAIH